MAEATLFRQTLLDATATLSEAAVERARPRPQPCRRQPGLAALPPLELSVVPSTSILRRSPRVDAGPKEQSAWSLRRPRGGVFSSPPPFSSKEREPSPTDAAASAVDAARATWVPPGFVSMDFGCQYAALLESRAAEARSPRASPRKIATTRPHTEQAAVRPIGCQQVPHWPQLSARRRMASSATAGFRPVSTSPRGAWRAAFTRSPCESLPSTPRIRVMDPRTYLHGRSRSPSPSRLSASAAAR